MAQTPLKNQPWKSAPARITGLPEVASVNTTYTVTLSAPGLDLEPARVVWEADGGDPSFGQSFSFTPATPERIGSKPKRSGPMAAGYLPRRI
jgi:hypothetical protein